MVEIMKFQVQDFQNFHQRDRNAYCRHERSGRSRERKMLYNKERHDQRRLMPSIFDRKVLLSPHKTALCPGAWIRLSCTCSKVQDKCRSTFEV